MELKLPNKTITVTGSNPETFDLDQLARIDSGNIEGEILTISSSIGQVALLHAEAESFLSEQKEACEILYSQKEFHYSTALIKEEDDGKGGKKVKNPTVDSIKAAIKRDEEYRSARSLYLEIQKSVNVLDKMYWTLKSKEKALSLLSIKDVNNGIAQTEGDLSFLNKQY